MTAPCFVVAGYSLILGDDNAGAYAAVITADKLLKALDIRIAQADTAFGGHGADRGGVMRTMNADPAGVQRKEPGAVGTFDYALAVTEIVRPVMRRANLFDAEGNLRRRHAYCRTCVVGGNSCCTAPGGGGAVVAGVLLVTGIFGNSDRIAADCLLYALLIDVKAVALLMDADEISGVAEQRGRRRRSCQAAA
mgnify:FL=1